MSTSTALQPYHHQSFSSSSESSDTSSSSSEESESSRRRSNHRRRKRKKRTFQEEGHKRQRAGFEYSNKENEKSDPQMDRHRGYEYSNKNKENNDPKMTSNNSPAIEQVMRNHINTHGKLCDNHLSVTMGKLGYHHDAICKMLPTYKAKMQKLKESINKHGRDFIKMEMLSAGKSQGIVGQSNQELRLFREMVNSYKNDGCEEMQKRMYHVMYGQFLTNSTWKMDLEKEIMGKLNLSFFKTPEGETSSEESFVKTLISEQYADVLTGIRSIVSKGPHGQVVKVRSEGKGKGIPYLRPQKNHGVSAYNPRFVVKKEQPVNSVLENNALFDFSQVSDTEIAGMPFEVLLRYALDLKSRYEALNVTSLKEQVSITHISTVTNLQFHDFANNNGKSFNICSIALVTLIYNYSCYNPFSILFMFANKLQKKSRR